MIINRYQITYSNGITQYKNLIYHRYYKEIIAPAKLEMDSLKLAKDFAGANKIKRELEASFGELWFTTESPLFRAIFTNQLEPAFNGMKPVPITLIRL